MQNKDEVLHLRERFIEVLGMDILEVERELDPFAKKMPLEEQLDQAEAGSTVLSALLQQRLKQSAAAREKAAPQQAEGGHDEPDQRSSQPGDQGEDAGSSSSSDEGE